jgi:hypothetical protein
MLSADLFITVVIAIDIILRSSWELLYRLLYRLLCRYSSWNIYWSLRKYLSLGIVVTLFRGTTCELGGSTSDINGKKRVNISSFFTTTNSVENNLSLSSLNSFLSTFKIMSWFRFILYSYIYCRESLALQGLSPNHSISKTIVLEPENESFNNIIELELPSIIRFISSILTIKSIENIASRKVILLK